MKRGGYLEGFLTLNYTNKFVEEFNEKVEKYRADQETYDYKGLLKGYHLGFAQALIRDLWEDDCYEIGKVLLAYTSHRTSYNEDKYKDRYIVSHRW